MRRIVSCAALLACATPLHAATVQPSAATLRAALAGDWSGVLGYRDYQTEKLTELPVQTRIENVADGVTQVRTSRFDEGPGQKPVWITTVSLDDARSGTVTSATFRAGGKVETETETVEIARYAGPASWTLTYRQAGSDDDKPADIRVTETRNGNELLSVKEVSAVGAGNWLFRNQTRLTRVVPKTNP